jgi:uncharacterized protein YqiB (DUF1249 family)
MFGLDAILKAAGVDMETVKKLSTQVATDFAELLVLTRENNAALKRLTGALDAQNAAAAAQTGENEHGG